ncbi:hypothetical protein D3C77_393210 [compost metagenome]
MLRHGENRKRKSDMIVKIALCFMNRIGGREQGIYDVLRRRLPVAARDANYPCLALLQIALRKPLERF